MQKVAIPKVPRALLNQLMAASMSDSKWLSENYTTLARRYPDQFVAVFNKRVIASHKDMSRLMKMVDTKLPRAARLVSTEYLTQRKATVIL